MATDTTVEHKLLGFAAPNYGNKPLAELAMANIQAVGMPKWTADDQAFAKLVQQTQARKVEPLRDKVTPLKGPVEEKTPTGGGSDDIGDIMWTVPTITVRYPSNIPNMIGHNVTSAMAMPATHVAAMQTSGRGPVVLDCTGVAVRALLARAVPSFGTQRNAGLAHSLLVTDDDVYAVALSLGEIDPDHGNAAAIIATDFGGKALEAPRLIVPGDAHAGRAVRGVISMEVK